MNLRIISPDGMLEASVDLPLSKSVSARALMINKIGGFDEPSEVADCDDIHVLRQALGQISGTVNVEGSGTAMRFVTAYYAATPGADVILTGIDRLKERPVRDLVCALQAIGADIEYLENEGFLPLHIKGNVLEGGEVTVNSTISSQYISALMMVAPMMKTSLKIVMEGEAVSVPYIKMTRGMMEQAGVQVEFMHNGIYIEKQAYTNPVSAVERDWSAASYWYAVTAMSAGWVTLNDMSLNSLQGDSEIIRLGDKFGVITSESEDVEGALELSVSPEQFSRIDCDMSNTPDLVPTVAVTAAALGIPFRFTGVKNLHHKECDRLQALKDEALKFGWIFDIDNPDSLAYEGLRIPITELPVVSSHGDHRIAMAFAPIALFIPGIIIENAEVVTKSYPEFWTQLEEAGFSIEEI